MIQNDKSMMQLCDMCSVTSTTMVVIVGHWLFLSLSLSLSLSLYGVCLRYLPTSFHVHQLLICVLSSLLGLVWSLTRAPRWIPPHLPHPSNPQLTLQEWVSVWCTPPPFALLLDAVLIMVPLLLYLQVGVHSQNRNQKQKNLKNKRNYYCFKKVHTECFFYCITCISLQKEKRKKNTHNG